MLTKLYKLLPALLISSCAYGQSTLESDLNFSMNQNIRAMKDPRNAVLMSQSYLINGKNVVGSPFLFEFWSEGEITTKDGRTYNGYKLKYDAFNQALHFSDGKDSMEVNEPASSFSLKYKWNNTVMNAMFIYYKKVENQTKPVFLEVVTDGKNYTLYKLNKKVISDLSSALPNTGGSLYFELKPTYYLRNNKTEKLKLIKPLFSNITELTQSDVEANPKLKDLILNIHNEEDLTKYVEVLNK